MSAPPVVLRVRGLSKSFGGLRVLNGVSFELRRGEVVLLRGGNGSGKTTLLNTLTGLLHPDAGSIEVFTEAGTAALRSGHSPEAMASLGVGRSWQEVRLFPHHTLEENVTLAHPAQLGERIRNLFLRRGDVAAQERAVRSEARKRLALLGLADRADDMGSRVSLGQSKRVAILRAVEAGAEVLFLDEPLSGLDAEGIRGVLGFMRELVASKRLTVVIVEHEFNVPPLLPIVDRICTLERGHLRESPSPAVDAPSEGALLAWLRDTAGGAGPVKAEGLPGGATLLRIAGRQGAADAVLEVRNITVRRGRRTLFTDAGGLSFTLRRGELAVLQAPNGWGKTSLLDAVVGRLAFSGTVHLGGALLNAAPVWHRTRLISYLRAGEALFPTLTAREALALAGRSDEAFPASLADRGISELSGGERQRLALLCASRTPSAPLSFYDEPFLSLDADGLQLLRDLMRAALRESAVLIALPSTPSL
ncbi:MAG TPA: ATP-binding cassette domain-containing protein [Longimicrobium sp.]|nr:ATP-binding cassette domain-containing protein [Longimicrobium sp.]